MTDETHDTNDATRTSVAFAYEPQDFIDGYQLWGGMTWRRAIGGLAWYIACLAAFSAFEPDWEARAWVAVGGLIGGALAIVGYRNLYLPFFARRYFRNYPLVRGEKVLSFGADGIRLTADRSDARFLWSDFIAWKRNDRSTLLFTSPRVFLVVPARLAALGAPIETMNAALAQQLGKPR